MCICIYKYISYVFVTLHIPIHEKHDIILGSNMKTIVGPEDRE